MTEWNKKKINVSEMALKVTAARASKRAMCCPPFRRLTSRLCTSKYFVNGFFEKDMARRKSKKKKKKKGTVLNQHVTTLSNEFILVYFPLLF